jgi:hypothetical protein
VGGAALVLGARGLAFVLRLLGNLVRNLGRVLITLYDIVIVLPLLVERLVKAKAPPPESEKLPVRRVA